MPVTASSRSGLPLLSRLQYTIELWNLYRRGAARIDVNELGRELSLMREQLGAHVPGGLAGRKLLEIGFGAKPHRLMYMSAVGLDVIGVDVDQPILNGSPREILGIFRKNGLMRALKSAIRFHLFDRSAGSANRALLRESAGRDVAFDAGRLIVADAGRAEFWTSLGAPPDVIFSYRVFEHIDRDSLQRIMENAARYAPEAIVYLVITVWTGLTGSHLVEWYPHRVGDGIPKKSEPWEHLRQQRFVADTYLNRMSRRDYLKLFQEDFEVLVDVECDAGLGADLLSQSVRSDLPDLDEYELLSNDVVFVLKPKPGLVRSEPSIA